MMHALFAGGASGTTFKPAKLLVSVVGRSRAEHYVKVTKAAGARGGTIMYGRSVEGNRLMQALSLADVHQEIVFTLMGAEAGAVLSAVRDAARANPKKWGGMAFLLDVSGLLMRVRPSGPGRSVESGESGKNDQDIHDTGNNAMESGFRLITAIVNNGYADDVMAAARKAGATGGTILNARGTGTEDDVKFFNIAIVPEKEMLIIVVDKDKVDRIVAAISATPHLCEPGGGIVYTMNVEEFFVLGK